MSVKNISLTMILLVVILLGVSNSIQADDGNKPQLKGVLTSFIENQGSFTITYYDEDGAATLKSVRLVIGQRDKNSHELAIMFDALKNRVSIKADGGVWKSASLSEVIQEDDCFLSNEFISIDLKMVTHVFERGYGSVILPLRFHADQILGTPGYEVFNVFATVMDQEGIRTSLKKHSAISIEYAMDEIANSIDENTFAGSEYQWKNWSGDQVDIKLELTTILPQEKERKFDLEDAGDLFFYSPTSGKVTMAATLQDVKVSNVSVETETVDERFKQFINFRLDFAEEQDAEDELIIRIYDQNSRGDYKLEAACAVPIWNIPTWWLPVTGYWFF